MAANIDIFDFALAADEVARINSLPQKAYYTVPDEPPGVRAAAQRLGCSGVRDITMEYRELSNGVRMPVIGYGVFQIPPERTERCVRDALEVGYRLIDTAQAYGNEPGVGKAIRESGIDRGEVFVTSKVWVSNMNYERAKASIDASLETMGLDHIDLMLLHQAYGDYHGAWRALEEAYHDGKLRAIGVSNFYPVRLMDMCALLRKSRRWSIRWRPMCSASKSKRMRT